MLVRPPNSILYEEGFWDEMADAGIDAVALQWLAVLDEQGGEQTRFPQIEDVHPRALASVCGEPVQRTPVSAYDPDPALYEGLSWPVPQMPPHLFDEGKRLREAIQMGVARGVHRLLHGRQGILPGRRIRQREARTDGAAGQLLRPGGASDGGGASA